MERSFLLALPRSGQAGQGLPLLLVFHGAGGRPSGIAEHTGLTAAATSRGYAVVYPAGIHGRWNDGRAVNAGPDDVAFVRGLIDSLALALPVDRKRIFATGISNGAGLAYRLACDLPGTFAAIAPVAGAPAAVLEPECVSTQPVSLVAFQGTADPLIPYEGGNAVIRRGMVLSATRSAALFAQVGVCATPPEAAALPDTATDGTRVRRTRYTGCRDDGEVVLYSIEGGGHTWPGGPPVGRRVGRVSRDIAATPTMLDFFDRHPRR